MKKLSLEVIEYLGTTDAFNDGHKMNSYKVMLKYGNKQYTLPFHMGMAHTSEPQLKDVMPCIISDRWSYENARDIEDFMSEFGYEDYKQAKQVYSACAKVARNVERLFGNDLELIEQKYQDM